MFERGDQTDHVWVDDHGRRRAAATTTGPADDLPDMHVTVRVWDLDADFPSVHQQVQPGEKRPWAITGHLARSLFELGARVSARDFIARNIECLVSSLVARKGRDEDLHRVLSVGLGRLSLSDGDIVLVRGAPAELAEKIPEMIIKAAPQVALVLLVPPDGSIELLDEEEMRKAGWVRAAPKGEN
jgi:hypothetical protein